MGVLVGVVNNQPVLVPVHQRIGQLQRHVLLSGFSQDGVDRCIGASRLRIPSHQRRRDADDGPVFLVVPLLERGGLRPLHHVERGGQHLVLHRDQIHRLVGDMLALGGNNRDGSPDLKYLFAKQNTGGRPAAQRDIAVFLRQIPPVQHRHHAGQRLGLLRIHALDPGVRMRAVQRASVQHAGHAHVLGVLAGIGDHPKSMQARHALANHLEGLGCGGRRRPRRYYRPGSGHPHLLRVERQHRGDHLMIFADQLVPGRIARQRAPVLLGQAGRVLGVLHHAQGIDFQSHLLRSPSLQLADWMSALGQHPPHSGLIEPGGVPGWGDGPLRAGYTQDAGPLLQFE